MVKYVIRFSGVDGEPLYVGYTGFDENSVHPHITSDLGEAKLFGSEEEVEKWGEKYLPTWNYEVMGLDLDVKDEKYGIKIGSKYLHYHGELSGQPFFPDSSLKEAVDRGEDNISPLVEWEIVREYNGRVETMSVIRPSA